MNYLFSFNSSIPTTSPVRGTAARVYSALLDPISTEDRYEAARHSSKRFWDVALLGGPLLMRHGGRALVAQEKGRALKQLLPGLALSAAAVGLLPLTGIVSAIHSHATAQTMASPEAAFVHRLKTAIAAHKLDIGRQQYMTKDERYGEMGLNGEVAQNVRSSPARRVRDSNSLDWHVGVWRQMLRQMPENF